MAPSTASTNTRVLRIKNTSGIQIVDKSYFTIQQAPTPKIQQGEILVRNLYLGLDPFNLLQFTGDPNQAVEESLRGYGLSEVIESKNSRFKEGDIVFGPEITWDTFSVQKDPTKLHIVPNARELAEQNKAPLSTYLGILGMPAFTAWQALDHYGDLKAGQTIFVSSAAGGIGQAAVQFAKLKGLTVIGSAGSQEKVDYVKNVLGADHVINYKTQNIRSEIDRIAPGGIDVFVDLVGEEMFDIALEKTRLFGRILKLGVVGGMNQDGSAVPYTIKNIHLVFRKELKVHGLGATYHWDEYPRFWAETQQQYVQGQLKATETIEEGLESIPNVFPNILTGHYRGKVVVKVADL